MTLRSIKHIEEERMNRFTWKRGFLGLLAIVMGTLLTAGICGPDAPTPQQLAQQKADTNQVYVPKNNVELDNYNARQKVADDPTTILWCTGAFPIPSSPLFTVPILGKLTSSTKRPFSTSTVVYEGSYSPELPGPDGMYGPSDNYRYGFTPGGVYVEFSGSMDVFCTTEPTVWQRQNTVIVVSTDDKLAQATQQCQALLNQKVATAPAQCQALLAAAVGK